MYSQITVEGENALLVYYAYFRPLVYFELRRIEGKGVLCVVKPGGRGLIIGHGIFCQRVIYGDYALM